MKYAEESELPGVAITARGADVRSVMAVDQANRGTDKRPASLGHLRLVIVTGPRPLCTRLIRDNPNR